jgi:aminoglycoside 6'-N-acetyltransferase I
MIVRPASEADFPGWAAMRRRLWPDADPDELEGELAPVPPLGLVAEAEGRLIGFAEASIRNYAEGAPAGPAAYLEGIWVEPEHRRQGVARALLAAVERWAREQGLSHLGSDALLDNGVSHRWHAAAGFAEVERLVVFGKPLR